MSRRVISTFIILYNVISRLEAFQLYLLLFYSGTERHNLNGVVVTALKVLEVRWDPPRHPIDTSVRSDAVTAVVEQRLPVDVSVWVVEAVLSVVAGIAEVEDILVPDGIQTKRMVVTHVVLHQLVW